MNHRIHLTVIYTITLFLIWTGILGPVNAALWDKRYVVKRDRGRDILCDSYLVQPNDWIYKIFRQKGEISEQDYPLFINIFKRINPRVSNINRIYPGDFILIPLKIITSETLPDKPLESVTIPFASISNNPIETVEIKKGDTVSKLMFQYFGNYKSKDYQAALRQFKELNPQIRDLNRIMVGQKVRLPLRRLSRRQIEYIPISTAENVKTDENVSVAIKMPEPLKSTHTGAVTPAPVKTEYSSVPESSLQTIAAKLKQIAVLLDGEIFDQGSYHFPVKGKNDVHLNLGMFPVILLKDGTRILFIRPFTRPLSDLSIIKSYWDPVMLVRIPVPSVSMYHLLDKVFAAIPKIRSKQKITFSEGQLRVDIRTRWILTMDKISGNPQHHICLVPVAQKERPFPEIIYRYLAKHNIDYWEIKPDGQTTGTSSRGLFNSIPPDLKQISAILPKQFLHQLASVLGGTFQEDVSVSCPYAGVQVETVSNMFTIDAAHACLVDFGSFAGDSIDAIEATGLKVASFNRPVNAWSQMQHLFDVLALTYAKNPTISVKKNRADEGLFFTYNGLMVPQTDGQTLFLASALPAEINSFLDNRGTQIVGIVP